MNATSTSASKLNVSAIFRGFLFLAFFLTFNNAWAIDYYTRANSFGWSNKNAWQYFDNGWKVAKDYPDINDRVFIDRSINIPSNMSFNCKSVVILDDANADIELNVGNGSILNVEEYVRINNPVGSFNNLIDVTPGSTVIVGGSFYIGYNSGSRLGTAATSVRANATNGIGTLKVKGTIMNFSNSGAPSSITLTNLSVLEIGGGFNIGTKLVPTIPANSIVRFNGTSTQSLPIMPIVPPATTAVKFGNLHIANSNGVLLTEPLMLAGNLVVENGRLEDKEYPISGLNSKDLIVWPGGELVLSYSDGTTSEGFPSGFGTNDLQTGSTVIYNGNLTQKLKVIPYSNLQLLGGPGKQRILLGPTTADNTLVSADLLLDRGSLSISNSTLTLTTLGSIQNYDKFHYISLGTNGKMVVETIGQTLNARSTEVTFPIGSAAGYSPAYLTNNGATYDFSIGVVNGVVDYATGNPLVQDGVNKTWDVECIGYVNGVSPATDVELRLQWNSATDELSKFDRTKCFVTHYTAGAWSISDIFQNAVNNGMSASMKNISSFSPFSVADAASPLPVELTFFKAAKKENTVLLNWETASEKNCLGYDILASADGKNFEFVGNVASKNGTANYVQKYEFTDKTSRTGLVYYRLKQTDLDGTATYYATQVVDMGRFTETLVAFPNPFQDRFELKLQSAAVQEVMLQIHDLTGKTVYQMNPKVVAGETVIPVELSQNLPAGIYILTAKTASQLFTSRIIKQ